MVNFFIKFLRSAGLIPRHAGLIDIIYQALVTVGVPTILDLNYLLRDKGNRTNGMSLIPWKLGQLLVWDATCADILVVSYLQESGHRGSHCWTCKTQNDTNIITCVLLTYLSCLVLKPYGLEARAPTNYLGTLPGVS